MAFEADLAREILRSLNMAKSFNLDPVITGAREADQVVADLKALNARVIYGLDYPARSRTLPPDADESVRDAARARPGAEDCRACSRRPASCSRSRQGAPAAEGFRAQRGARGQGWPGADAAVRALTINAARIAGAADRLGSLEKGKIANVIVTDGDLFEDRTRVVHVFIDGRKVEAEQPAPAGGRGRGRGGN